MLFSEVKHVTYSTNVQSLQKDSHPEK
jgi:hypothetical protein